MRISKHWITFGVFVLALLLYAVGFATSAVAVVLLGVAVELYFWARILMIGFRRRS
ncbi:MAG: hypothetical protein AAF529_18485 [Pseudomonadota bacterium]